MKSLYVSILFLCMLTATGIAVAAPPVASESVVLQIKRPDSTINLGKSFESNGVFLLRNGDVATINMDSSWLFSKGAYMRLGAFKEWNDSILVTQRNTIRLYELQQKKVDSLLQQYRAMDSIQTRSFDSLLTLNSKLDSVLTRSIANTEKSLDVAQRLKWQSYLMSTLLGAVAGYTIQDKWYGALAGAGSGFLLNCTIMKLSF